MVIKETSYCKILKAIFPQKKNEFSFLTDFLVWRKPMCPGSDHEIRRFHCFNIHCKSSTSCNQSHKLTYRPQPFHELCKFYHAIWRKRQLQLGGCTWDLCPPPPLTTQGPPISRHPPTQIFNLSFLKTPSHQQSNRISFPQ